MQGGGADGGVAVVERGCCVVTVGFIVVTAIQGAEYFYGRTNEWFEGWDAGAKLELVMVLAWYSCI